MNYVPSVLRRSAAAANRRGSRGGTALGGGGGRGDDGGGGGGGGGGVRVSVWRRQYRLAWRHLPAAAAAAVITTALLLLTLKGGAARWGGPRRAPLPWLPTTAVRGAGNAPAAGVAWAGGGATAAAAAAAGAPAARLAAAAARLATGAPVPADVIGGCVGRAAAAAAAAGATAAADGVLDALGVGCCTRLLHSSVGSAGGGDGGDVPPVRFHDSLATPPGPVEVARRVNVSSPPDADTVFSIVVPYKGYLYTLGGRGLGVERAHWPDGWARRWTASAAVALDALGVALDEGRAAGVARLPPASAPPPAALASLTVRQTHHRLSADGGDVWVFDIDAVAAARPTAADAASVAAAAAAAVAVPPPLMTPRAVAGAGATPAATLFDWNVVVSRPLVGDDVGDGRGCTVATFPRTVSTPLTLVVPYAARPSRLAAFLAAYKRLRYDDPALSLLISTLPPDVADVTRVVAAAALPMRPAVGAPPPTPPTDGSLPSRPPLTDGVMVITTGGDRNGAFSRSVAVRDAVARLPRDALFFVTDVDLTVTAGALHNCRANALPRGQAWFPIFWNYYAATPPGLSPATGFWRTSSYGAVCAHRSSWDAVGGFGGAEEDRFVGWGSEDVAAYQAFRDDPSMGVMRGLEPGLTHAWHTKTCAHNAAYDACMRTLTMSMASQERLAAMVVAGGVDAAAALGVRSETGKGMG